MKNLRNKMEFIPSFPPSKDERKTMHTIILWIHIMHNSAYCYI